ncbi:hypothetical protein ACH5RR_002815 [Cinchona calisaya]|uniref:Uncharacterized protein n=1 Tax=Cinchona calisaya TaxID=153742 RepID=A0ABD3AT66_9GENT
MQMEMKEFDSSSSTAEDSRNGGQRLPPQFREFIEKQFKEKTIIDEETLVIEKRLFGGDVPESLTIPPKFLKIDLTKFLNYDENKILMKSKERKPGTRNTDDKDIPVIFIGPELKRDEVSFGMRKKNSSKPDAPICVDNGRTLRKRTIFEPERLCNCGLFGLPEHCGLFFLLKELLLINPKNPQWPGKIINGHVLCFLPVFFTSFLAQRGFQCQQYINVLVVSVLGFYLLQLDQTRKSFKRHDGLEFNLFLEMNT